MRVVSINVSLPKEVEWRGQKITTAILKEPVTGPVTVKRLNIEGDAQADLNAHGGEHRAVFVYQVQSYDYWKDYLKRSDLHYGQFGENLTVDGLPDAEVCIGDQYQAGSVIFEVTQPRVTCYKIGISLGIPEMPALLVAHQRPGFYFRVIQEGVIVAGDVITKIKSGPEAMPVAQVDQLLYSSNHPKESLEKVLRISALSSGWQWSFRGLLDAANNGTQNGNAGLSQTRPVAWTGFKPFTVRKIRQECFGIKSFELICPELAELPDFMPGQHIALRLPVTGDDIPVIRMYSLCGPPKTNFYRIAVKLELNGVGSSYLHDKINEGDSIGISAPRGDFVMTDKDCPVVLLSAGVGITPMLAMLNELAALHTRRKIYWVYSVKNTGYYAFAEAVRELENRLVNHIDFRVYSSPANNEKIGVDYNATGHLNLDLLKQLSIPTDAECYICGPGPYLSAVTDALKSLGLPSEKIRFETFGNLPVNANSAAKPPHLPADNSGVGPVISFTKSNISFKWNDKYNNLLEAAEAADIPVHWSCRVGVCHRCESGCLDGKVSYDPQPFDDPSEGNILLCCSKPISAVQLDL